MWLGYLQDIRSDQNLLKTRELSKSKLQREITYNHFSLVGNDLMQLADHVQLHELFEPGGARAKDILIKEFETVLGKTGMYYKIRVLDATGREIIKVQNPQIKAPHAAIGRLVEQSNRDYFRESMRMSPGEVYVSGFDLSAPTGMVEYPLTAVIRFGTPVMDRMKRKKGCVIINFFGAHLISELEEAVASASSRMLIVDSRGFWIRAIRPGPEWGWIIPNNRTQRMQVWDPVAWSVIARQSSGQIQTDKGLFTFARVYPWFSNEVFLKTSAEKLETKAGQFGAANQGKYWTLISFIPRAELNALKWKRLQYLSWALSALLVFILLISWIAARANERRQVAEEALRENEKKYRYMFESNLVGVLYFDLAGKILDANEYFMRLTEHTAEEARAGELSLTNVIEPKTGNSPGYWEKIIGQGRMDSAEMNAVRDDGTRVPVSCMAALFPEKSQGILLVIDLTERHRLEDMRKRLFSTLSHELKNPLAIIISYFRLLEKSHQFSDDEKDFINIINRNTGRLKTLADSILTVEQLEFSQAPAKLVAVNFSKTVRQAVDSVKLMACEKGLDLSADLEPRQELKIRAQQEHIEELVTNLIVNALKYTLKGRVTVKLALAPENAGEVELRVEDTGIGIQPENLQKIFEGFYRIPSELQNNISGSGLGLRIVKDIVDMYGGTIRVESVPNQGSCFVVRLPVFSE
jgi:PAS domain S-box-containing protein